MPALGLPERLRQSRRRHVLSHKEPDETVLGEHSVKSAALVGLCSVTVYCGLRGVLQGYQCLRRRALRSLLLQVSPVLNSLKVQYWADFGTLLGMHRDGDVILHDSDVDLVVLNPDWEALAAVLQHLLPRCRVYFVVPSEDSSVRWLRVSAAGGIMDLYGGYYKSGDNISIPQGHGDLCDVRHSLVFPLSSTKFRGVEVSVPRNVPAVLQHRYGPTWHIPRYMDKGRDTIEQRKLYARILGALGRAGLRI